LLDGRLGLARVEALLEVATDDFAAREHRIVAQPAGRELHDADVVVPFAMTARVGRGLVESPQAVALPPSPQLRADTYQMDTGKETRARVTDAQFAAKTRQGGGAPG